MPKRMSGIEYNKGSENLKTKEINGISTSVPALRSKYSINKTDK